MILNVTVLLVNVFVFVINVYLRRKDKESKLEDELRWILGLGIKYPYLESGRFTENWRSDIDLTNEENLRYDVYCNIVFNYWSRVCRHFKYSKKRVEDFVDIKTWVRLHKKNWQNPVDGNENIDSYDQKFRDFINLYLI